MVPYALPLRKAKSSTPRTLTLLRAAHSAVPTPRRMRSRRTSGLTARPSPRARRAPASPPSSRAIASRASSSRPVLRARAAISGSLSQKTRLSHLPRSQKNRRARTSTFTAIPRQGRSETVRA